MSEAPAVSFGLVSRLEEHLPAKQEPKRRGVPVVVPATGAGRMPVVTLIGQLQIEGEPFVELIISPPS